eukprot:TRINITY_DN1559_c3_g2_i1.p1 TRINITY_DN1559_c3_g2~~TRINITY_DN1559_c3_g2_i1.p1  ORF type:complete len:125 (-),score=2.67 TRINITY_DN1559_c3_g2_i1:245-619(-)
MRCGVPKKKGLKKYTNDHTARALKFGASHQHFKRKKRRKKSNPLPDWSKNGKIGTGRFTGFSFCFVFFRIFFYEFRKQLKVNKLIMLLLLRLRKNFLKKSFVSRKGGYFYERALHMHHLEEKSK